MKQISLLYNSHTDEYYFSNTLDPYTNHGRKAIFEEELLNHLKVEVDPERKSLLTLLNVKQETAEKIKVFFKNSKVSVKVKSEKL
ncbi:MAG: hypothetical protein ABIH28_00140 [archaeon]